MPKVLLIDPTPLPLVERIRPLFPAGADLDVVPTYSEEDLARHAAETEILFVVSRKVDARLLSFVPRVRFVQRVGVNPFSELQQRAEKSCTPKSASSEAAEEV